MEHVTGLDGRDGPVYSLLVYIIGKFTWGFSSYRQYLKREACTDEKNSTHYIRYQAAFNNLYQPLEFHGRLLFACLGSSPELVRKDSQTYVRF